MSNHLIQRDAGPGRAISTNANALLSGLMSKNLDEAVMAAREVSKAGSLPPEFMEATSRVVHGQARALIYENMGASFGMKAYGLLEKALIEGSWDEREAAFRGLTRIGDKAAPHLKAFVQNSIRDSSLQDAIYFAIRAMASILGNRAAPILKTWAKGKEITVACYGIEAMADTGDGSCGKYLIELLGNKSNIIRDVAFRTIERIGSVLVPVLKDGLTSPDPSVRAACFILLGKVLSSKAIPAMKGFMGSDNPELRLLVVKALQGIDTEEASGLLVNYLSDSSYLVRDGAVRALVARGQKSISILKATLQSGEMELKRLCMRILVSIGGLEALLPLHAMLMKGSTEERLTVAEALRNANDPFTLNAMTEVLATARGGTAMAIFDNLMAIGPEATRRVLEFSLEHPSGSGLFHWLSLLASGESIPGLPIRGFDPAKASPREISLRLYMAILRGDFTSASPLIEECGSRSQGIRSEISTTLSKALCASGHEIDPAMASRLRNSGIGITTDPGFSTPETTTEKRDKTSSGSHAPRETNPPAKEAFLPEEPLSPSASYTGAMTFSNIVKQILDNEGEGGIAKLILELENSMTPRDIAPILKVYYEMDPNLEGVAKIAHIIEKSGIAQKVASILMDCFEDENYYSSTLTALAKINAKVRKAFLDCIDGLTEDEEGPARKRLMKLLRGNSFDTLEYLAGISGKLKNQEFVSLFASEIGSNSKHPKRGEILSRFAEKLTDLDFREACSARNFFSCLGEEGATFLLEKCEDAKSKTFNAVVLEFLEENRKLFPYLKEWVGSFKPSGDEARDLKNGILKCLASVNAL